MGIYFFWHAIKMGVMIKDQNSLTVKINNINFLQGVAVA